MPNNVHLLSKLLLVTVLATATGCPTNNQSSAPPTTHSPAAAQAPAAEPLPTDALSDMAFSVELINPSTGLPMHTSIDALKPTLLREIERITYEPTLRQVLNKLTVQNTQWFKQFEGNLDAAYEVLRESIAAHHIPGTPLFRVYALRSLKTDTQEEAQVILKALRDEYLRQNNIRINASIDVQLRNAQRARDDAEQAVMSNTVQLKRFLENNPISSSGSVERSRMNALEFEALQRQLKQAEARRDQAIKEIATLNQQTKGFLGYFVAEEYPPQKAR